MQRHLSPLEADRAFFGMLLRSDARGLNELLTEDFVLIEVVGGGEIPRRDLVAGMEAGQVSFQAIEPSEVRVRTYGAAAVVTGRTAMSGRAGDRSFSLGSRYTHVYVQRDGAWFLASAQGTPIADP